VQIPGLGLIVVVVVIIIIIIIILKIRSLTYLLCVACMCITGADFLCDLYVIFLACLLLHVYKIADSDFDIHRGCGNLNHQRYHRYHHCKKCHCT